MAKPAGQQQMVVGDIRITYLPDGYGRYVPSAMFPASTPEAWALHREWLDDEGRVVITFGALLIETVERKILVDAGYGEKQSEVPGLATRVGGSLLRNLETTGVKPADIDTVLYSHLHHDHVGWTTIPNGTERVLTFPNARHLVRRPEWDYWKGTDNPPGPSMVEVQAPLENRIELVEAGQAVAPGINLLATPGHTPGHSSVVVSSGAQRAIILGDVVHCPIQLEETDWGCLFDVDPELGKRTRSQLAAELEKPSTLTVAGHFADFVFGRVMRARGKLHWQGGLT